MIYLDASALVNLIEENERTGPLRAWIDRHADQPFATSQLTEVELARTLHKLGHPSPVDRAERLLEGLMRVEADAVVRGVAARLPDPFLRSLDAVHISSAQQLGPRLMIVTYDRKMARAASHFGATAVSPGV